MTSLVVAVRLAMLTDDITAALERGVGGRERGELLARVAETCVLPDGAALLAPADLLVVLDALADAAVLRGTRGRACCLDCIGFPAGQCEAHREDLDAAAAYEVTAARLGDYR